MKLSSILRTLAVIVILAAGLVLIYDAAILSPREAEKVKECEAIWAGEGAGLAWLMASVPITPEDEKELEKRKKEKDEKYRKCLEDAHKVRLFNR